MDGGENLRLAIVGDTRGASGLAASRRARRRFVSPRRLLRYGVIGAAGLALAGLAALRLSGGIEGGAPATLAVELVESAGSGVARARAPAAPAPPRPAAADGAPRAAAEAPPLPSRSAAERRTLSADRLIARAAPIARPDGRALGPAPVRLDRGLWPGGACADLGAPAIAAFCSRDGALYAPDRVAAETRALFALARGIGAQAWATAGLLLEPVDGAAATLRRDCLAGLWAGGSDATHRWLNPERLALALDPDSLGGWPARRVAAFRIGYRGADIMACNRPERRR